MHSCSSWRNNGNNSSHPNKADTSSESRDIPDDMDDIEIVDNPSKKSTEESDVDKKQVQCFPF